MNELIADPFARSTTLMQRSSLVTHCLHRLVMGRHAMTKAGVEEYNKLAKQRSGLGEWRYSGEPDPLEDCDLHFLLHLPPARSKATASVAPAAASGGEKDVEKGRKAQQSSKRDDSSIASLQVNCAVAASKRIVL